MQIALGLVSAGIAYAGIAGLLVSPRVALIGLMIVGMALCSTGMKLDKFPFSSPWTITGGVLGVFILIVGLAGIFGIKLPYLTDSRVALIGVAALMVIKVVIALVRGAVA